MWKKLYLILGLVFFISLLLFSCSGDSDNDSNDTNSDSIEDSESVTRPIGWSDETHGKTASPNYDIVFQEESVLRLDLVIDSENWQAMLADMTEIYGEFGSTGQPGMPPGGGGGGMPGNYSSENPVWKPCTVMFDGITWSYVGVRFKGNSSLRDTWGMGLLKLPLRFDFDQFEDEYPEIDDQRFYGFKKLSLSSGFHDDSFVREKVVADIFRDAGVPAPRTAFYRLFVDYGEGAKYFGLYTMVEIPDDPMISQQFQETDGNLYKPQTNLATYDQESFDKETNEDEADYSDVSGFYNALHHASRESDPDTWKAALEATFDVDGFLLWLAVNTVIQNWDTYGISPHNFYLYNDPGDGLIHWIPWDNNEALNSDRRLPLSLNLSAGEVGDNWPLIRYVVDDSDYWDQYVAYVKTTVEEVFYPERMTAIYEQAHELVRPYTVGDEGEIDGFSFLSDPDDFDTALDYLYDHVEERYNEAELFVD